MIDLFVCSQYLARLICSVKIRTLLLPIKGIVFDKDGTLLDFNATWVPVNRVIASLIADGDRDIIARMLSESGQDDVAGTVRSGSLLAAGNNHQIAESWQKIAPHHGIETIAALINDVGKSAAAFTAKPVPDLQNTIEALANRGYKLGLPPATAMIAPWQP